MLIGHWWEEKPNTDAALKAFLTTRTGDIGLMIGVIITFFAAGQTLQHRRASTTLALDGEIGHTICCSSARRCLLIGIIGKSGQFPLHTWLPDAMAGPTPVSALIHAATMVVAGVYLGARALPACSSRASRSAPAASTSWPSIGGITIIIGAALAFVQDDIKKVLAYSTISQLGYMVMALGVGAWTAAVFHLFTHAFFKACLFLGAGSVSHSGSHHSFDMKKDMGGLRKYMPNTFWTFMIGTLALAGIFPLAGFWSKDEILAGTAGQQRLHVLPGRRPRRRVHDRGLHDPLRVPHVLRRVPRPRPPARVAEASITVPADRSWPASAIVAGLRQPADRPCRLGHREVRGVRRADVSRFPARRARPTFDVVARRDLDRRSALVGIGVGLPLVLRAQARGRSRASPSATRAARAGNTFLVNKYYLDDLYTDIIVGGDQGPDRPRRRTGSTRT